MRKLLGSLVAALVCFGIPATAQMSDEAIISYIAQGVSDGKTKTQIGADLLAKGVTRNQVQRLVSNFDSQATQGDRINEADTDSKTNKRRVHNSFDLSEERTSNKSKEKTGTKTERETIENSDNTFYRDADNFTDVAKDKVSKDKSIFGHDVFSNSELTFEPNDNMATPAGYILGPGDEVLIDVWGINEASISKIVSPEGVIFVSQVGQIHLSGLTIEQATGKIRSALSKKYSLSGENPASQISVTLGKVRSIVVNILGEVNFPGTYRLSSLSTVFNALYRAGGVTKDGSLRNIQVFRAGKLLDTADIYDFIFYGKTAGNVSLSDGDLIVVPISSMLVEMKGGFKRPMFYEAKEGESVDKLVEYAGGFTANAYRDVLTVQRRSADNGKVYSLKNSDLSSFILNDGDVITAYSNNRDNIFDNRVEIKGMVMRPGIYAIGKEIATVRQLVEHAGGLLEDAFTARAQLFREKTDRSLEIKAINIGNIMNGSSQDVLLQKNDILIISDTNEINVKGDITINGYVLNPGDYTFAEGMTIEDLILLAGGLDNGASTARVDISRRILDSGSESADGTLAKIYSFPISEGLVVNPDPSFTLQPFDIVSVRKSPTYVAQKNVRISGEITFPGEYTLVSNNERLSDIYKRAGKSTPNGYIPGATLKRRINEDERNIRRNMEKLADGVTSKKDSLRLTKLSKDNTYSIGIDLGKAISYPGSEYDVVLQDGDEIIIPSQNHTVRVQGEVLYPNAVSFKENANVLYYIEQAGGFSNEAKRRQVYVVHMNGTVSVGMGSKVDPGSEIIVPVRQSNKTLSTGEWLAIGSTSASIATMVATIVNLLVRK